MAVSKAAVRLGASTLGALALGLCIGLAASPSSRHYLASGGSSRDGIQPAHFSLRELDMPVQSSRAEAGAQELEADDMAEVLGDEPEDMAMAQVVLQQAAEDQEEGLPFNTAGLLPALIGAAENEALQSERQPSSLVAPSTLSSRQKDTCTHDLEQLYGCSELGANSVSKTLADRSICCKRLANLTDRGCFCGWGKGEEMRSWVRLLLLDLADVAVQACQLDVPCTSSEVYFQAGKDEAGSQSGQELAHAVHQAVGDMLSDSTQLSQGQEASDYAVAHPQDIVAMVSGEVPQSLAPALQSEQLVLPGTEAMQGGLVRMHGSEVEAAEQDQELSDQLDASSQSADSGQAQNSELTIEVELSGDGSMPSTATLREEGKQLLANWFTSQLASDSEPVRTSPRLFGKQEMASSSTGSLGALVEGLVDMMWRSLDSSTSEGDMKVELTVETSQPKGSQRAISEGSPLPEQQAPLAVFDPAVRQGTQLSEEGLAHVDGEQKSLAVGQERRQAAALQQGPSQQDTAETDTLSQWLAEHMQQSAMSTYFFTAGLLMLGLSTALFLYYSCSRLCQTNEAHLPSWRYQQISPLAPIEEGEEEDEKQTSASFPLSGILSAKDHIAPSLREPLLDTQAALSNV